MNVWDDGNDGYFGERSAYEGLTFVRTCIACPEQYDVFDEDNNMVGYVRLRHGTFRVSDENLEHIFLTLCPPLADGIFDTEAQRTEYLGYAAETINRIRATD